MTDETEKGIGAARTSAPSSFEKRWAVLVGISEYRAPNINLKYAHRDIEELWNLLKTNRCYRFIEERTKILLNSAATTTNILKAIRSFLQEVGPKDLVLLYFSGHAA